MGEHRRILAPGHRGLPGNSSVARLLAKYRGHRCKSQLPHLTEKKILAWAKAHHGRTGKWPNALSGSILEAPGETWAAVVHTLQDGLRGHPGGTTLRLLLQREFGVRHHLHLPRLTEKQILKWAKSHFRRTGSWPSGHSGPVADAAGETWCAVETALYHGCRGLPGGSSVRRLLRRCLPSLAQRFERAKVAQYGRDRRATRAGGREAGRSLPRPGQQGGQPGLRY